MGKYKKLSEVLIVLVVAILVVMGLFLFIKNLVTSGKDTSDSVESSPVTKTVTSMPKESPTTDQFQSPPAMNLVQEADYWATLKTSKGDILIDLFESKTPVTVNNFNFLAEVGFYNGTRSHRIIKDFMVQWGDPLTKDINAKSAWGTGGPGYRFNDEAFEGEYKRGVVAMANSGPNTNGSQFFIMHQDRPLPQNYVIFGEVTDAESLKVLDEIANTPVVLSRSGEKSSPAEDVVLKSVEITLKNTGAVEGAN